MKQFLLHQQTQTEETVSAFDQWSGHWSGHYAQNGEMGGRIDRFVAALSARVTDGARVLDYGCGTGEITQALAAKGWRAEGCDMSSAMIDKARQGGGAALDWITLLPEKPLPLPFEDEAFAAVISSSVFEYLASPEVVIAELNRILAPGGWFMFTVPDPRHPIRRKEEKKAVLARNQLFWRLIRLTRWESEFRYLRISVNRPDIAVWLRMLHDAGFTVRDPGPCNDPLALLAAKKEG